MIDFFSDQKLKNFLRFEKKFSFLQKRENSHFCEFLNLRKFSILRIKFANLRIISERFSKARILKYENVTFFYTADFVDSGRHPGRSDFIRSNSVLSMAPIVALVRSKWPSMAFDSLSLILVSFRLPIALRGVLAYSDMILIR